MSTACGSDRPEVEEFEDLIEGRRVGVLWGTGQEDPVQVTRDELALQL